MVTNENATVIVSPKWFFDINQQCYCPKATGANVTKLAKKHSTPTVDCLTGQKLTFEFKKTKTSLMQGKDVRKLRQHHKLTTQPQKLKSPGQENLHWAPRLMMSNPHGLIDSLLTVASPVVGLFHLFGSLQVQTEGSAAHTILTPLHRSLSPEVQKACSYPYAVDAEYHVPNTTYSLASDSQRMTHTENSVQTPTQDRYIFRSTTNGSITNMLLTIHEDKRPTPRPPPPLATPSAPSAVRTLSTPKFGSPDELTIPQFKDRKQRLNDFSNAGRPTSD
ncbi:unnamed protein product [Orchesella dallaii]|uniref:Uncharacterized protein n=1 Tax=Orchesella dallaii TaxID=48710 RepID=A0ABP1R1W9_9HEXA